MKGHDDDVTAIASIDNEQLVSGSLDGTVKV